MEQYIEAEAENQPKGASSQDNVLGCYCSQHNAFCQIETWGKIIMHVIVISFEPSGIKEGWDHVAFPRIPRD